MGHLGLESIMQVVSWQHCDVLLPWRLISDHLQMFAGNFLVTEALSSKTLTYVTVQAAGHMLSVSDTVMDSVAHLYYHRSTQESTSAFFFFQTFTFLHFNIMC